MARIVITLLGLALCAVGIWLMVIWWAFVAAVLLAAVAVGLTLLGLIVLVFGISEIAGALAGAKIQDASPTPEEKPR